MAGKWVKGVSANPGGIAKGYLPAHLLARKHVKKAIDTLVLLLTDPDASPRMKFDAANALLDRAYGKPRESLEVSSESRTFSVNATAADMRSEIMGELQSLGLLGHNGPTLDGVAVEITDLQPQSGINPGKPDTLE